MDLSALIFVALAVAWAVYLVPKALRHHEEDAESRTIDGFSDQMRVLARREAVSATEAELVTAGRPVRRREAVVETTESADVTEESADESAAPTPAPRARPTGMALTREATRRATARRRRVFNLLLAGVVVVVALVIGKVITAPWVAIPVALMALWLVACRLMVRKERAVARTTLVRKRRRTLADEVIEAEDAAAAAGAEVAAEAVDLEREDTDQIPVVSATATDPNAWTPVPVPLPTYVAKAPAGRTVRTIDLDATGVWSSGRNEADSRLAREADAQRTKSDVDADVEQRRASGS